MIRRTPMAPCAARASAESGWTSRLCCIVPYFGRRATEWAQVSQTVVKELGPKAKQANAIQVSPNPDLEMLAAEANAIITETQDLPDRLLQLLREIGALAIRSRDTGERTDMDEVDPGMVHMLDRVKGQGSAQE